MKKFLYPLLLCILFTVSLFGQYTDEKYEKYVGYARGKYPLTLSGLQRAIAAVVAVDSGVVNIAYPGVDTTGLGVLPPRIYLRGWISGEEIVSGVVAGTGTWGYITGDITEQTDLQEALSNKLDLSDTSHKVLTSNLIYNNKSGMRDTLLYSDLYEKFLGIEDGKYDLSVAGVQSAIADLPNDSGTVYISYPGIDTTGLGTLPNDIILWGWILTYVSGNNTAEVLTFQIETSASSTGNFYTTIDDSTYTTVIDNGDVNTIVATKIYNTLYGNVTGWTITKNSFRITLTHNTYGDITDPTYNASAIGATVTTYSRANGTLKLYSSSYTQGAGYIVVTPAQSKVVVASDSMRVQGKSKFVGNVTLPNTSIWNTTGVGIGTITPRTTLEGVGALLFTGTAGAGWTEPNLGAGTRLLWYPRKAAFRVGTVTGTQWNDANIGENSVAFSYNNIASGKGSIAIGSNNSVSGSYSTVIGDNNTATYPQGVALGTGNTIDGDYGVAIGVNNSTYGSSSRAFGTSCITYGIYSTAFGFTNIARSYLEFVIGRNALDGGSSDTWVATDPLFSVGIGTSTNNRLNGFTVFKNGNAEVYGTLKVGHIYTFPATDGTSGYVLKTNGAGIVSWQADASGIGGAAYADSLLHDGRHVPGDSLITDAEGNSRFQAKGTYLIPSDSTSMRSYSNAKYQAKGTYLIPSDSTSIRNYSNAKYQAKGTYLIPSDSTSMRNYSNAKYQAKGTYLIPSDSTSMRSYSNAKYQYKFSNIAETSAGDSIKFYNKYTFPRTDGNSGQILKTNGNGEVTWQIDASGLGGASFADSVSHDGRHVVGDSLITDAEGTARFEPKGVTISDVSLLQDSLTVKLNRNESIRYTKVLGLPDTTGVTTGYVMKKQADGTIQWNNDATGGAPVWGNISGTLANQTDLQGALNSKSATGHLHAASDITSGIIDTARFHAYADLVVENKVGTGSAQVAAGNHTHSGVYEPVITKNTAFNKNFGTATTDIAAIGATLGNSQVVETDGTGKLITAAKGTAYNKAFGTTSGTVSEGNHAHTGVYEPASSTIMKEGENISLLNNNSGYITGNQTITLSGDVTGSGAVSISATVKDSSHIHSIANVTHLQDTLTNKVNLSTFNSYIIEETKQPGFVLGSNGTWNEYSRTTFKDSLNLFVSGTATIPVGDDSVIVTHNYGSSPTISDISITPQTNTFGYPYWITAVGSATFKVKLGNVGLETRNASVLFSWQIWKRD
jgi:hypothetical protein